MEDDWSTIRWDKVNSLSGGTKQYGPGLGLSPWYLSTFNATAPTFASSSPTTPFNVVSVTQTPVPASPAVAASINNATSGARLILHDGCCVLLLLLCLALASMALAGEAQRGLLTWCKAAAEVPALAVAVHGKPHLACRLPGMHGNSTTCLVDSKPAPVEQLVV